MSVRVPNRVIEEIRFVVERGLLPDGDEPCLSTLMWLESLLQKIDPTPREKANKPGTGSPLQSIVQGRRTGPAAPGVQGTASVQKVLPCDDCFGEGGRWDNDVIDQYYECETCNGTGITPSNITGESQDGEAPSVP